MDINSLLMVYNHYICHKFISEPQKWSYLYGIMFVGSLVKTIWDKKLFQPFFLSFLVGLCRYHSRQHSGELIITSNHRVMGMNVMCKKCRGKKIELLRGQEGRLPVCIRVISSWSNSLHFSFWTHIHTHTCIHVCTNYILHFSQHFL